MSQGPRLSTSPEPGAFDPATRVTFLRRLVPGAVLACALLLPSFLAGCGDTGFSEGYLEATARRTRHQVINEVRLRARQFAPTEMRVDLTGASQRERELLQALLRAAGLADEIFWRQTGNIALPYRAQVRASYPRDHIVREFYMLQMGPYDRLDRDRPYMDVPPKPPGAGFYPPDLTVEEFRSWLEAHPEDREAFRDPYTVIRRRGEGLVAVPYHEEYREMVEPMAEALREAASHARNPRLERYLELKADAVLTDEYYDADTAWIRMDDAPFDVVIGPYEVSEDRLLNLKAAYGASVGLVDSAASADLDRYRRRLDEVEAALPYPDSFEPAASRLSSTFTVVRDIYRGGRMSTGLQPLAASLPTDPRVQSTGGTKTTFWRNVLDARFDSIISPIGQEVLAEDQRDALSADAFFDFVISREMARGLGPRSGSGAAGEERLPANRALGDHHAWIEESRADLVGLLALELPVEGEAADSERREEHLASYVASLLQSVRLGTEEAHGLAARVSLNWYLDHGGLSFDDESERYRVDPSALRGSIRSLAEELLAIEAEGNPARAERLKAEYGSEPPSLETLLGRLENLPVDVVPRYRIRW